jgi:peroxiredoxin
MPAYQADLARFAELDAQVVGISPDSPYSHIAWQKKEIGRLDYLLLSDFWPHGNVADSYGVLRREGPPLPGISERAIFIVDKEGKIAFAHVYDLGQQPPNEDLLESLRKLRAAATSGR